MSIVAPLNLLPETLRALAISRRRRRRWILCVSATASVMCAVWCFARMQGGEVRRVRRMGGEIAAQFRREQKRERSLETRAAFLVQQSRLLRSMRAADHWADHLLTIARSVPDGVVLSHLAVTPPASDAAPRKTRNKPAGPSAIRAGLSPARILPPPRPPHTVQLEGYAQQPDGVLAFVRELRGSQIFKHVRLVRSSEDSAGAERVVHFNIICQRQAP